MKILQVGTSNRSVCGVRDYAAVVAEELRLRGHEVTNEWLAGPTSVPGARRWLDQALRRAGGGDVDVVLWQYSVFAYAHHGVPVLSIPYAEKLWRGGLPTITVMHEFAFPWGRNALRGTAWAVTQRLALLPVVGASSGVVVSTERSAAWLQSRRWLPQRPVIIAPVVSALPEVVSERPSVGAEDFSDTAPLKVGMFGYPPRWAHTIARAIADLSRAFGPVELCLVGAPGPGSAPGEAWRRAAAEAGVGNRLSFTGVVTPESLVSELASCQLCIFDDGGGPSARKSTLAALLACGRPVVAADGPDTWRRLVDDQAVRLVPNESAAMGHALVELANDPVGRHELGCRARDFYHRYQARKVVAGTLERFLRERLDAERASTKR